MIQQLQVKEGKLQYNMEKKKGIVQEFFKELYKQEEVTDEKINHYLKGETMSVLMEEERVMLNRDITLEELRKAIKKPKKTIKCQEQTDYRGTSIKVYEKQLI
uniref:Uncharacterized protein n=1 Tax=Micrurus lemniscatus lemniscatus TaxID=129467 RepID=A0A2D4HPZ2_MICLE